MSGIIQIAEKTPAWRIALRALYVAAPLVGLAWYGLRDDDAPAASQPAPPPPVAVVHRTPVTAALVQSAETHIAASTAATAPQATAASADTDSDAEFAARNANVDVRLLTSSRPASAQTFLTEVLLKPSPQGGFVVSDVMADSRYERLGLRPGDVIYSLDTPKMLGVDENSMVSLIQQTEIELDVYRNGSLTRLHYNLASSPEDDTHAVNR